MIDNLISSIVRFHDGANVEYLKEALFSLSFQSYPHVQTILCLQNCTADDCKFIEDMCNEILYTKINSKYAAYKIIRKSFPIGRDGRSILLNEGINEADGHFILFLDYDDIMYQNAFEKLIESAQLSNAVITIGGTVKSILKILDNGTYYITSKSRWIDRKVVPLDLIVDNYFPIHSYIINKKLIKSELLCFNEEHYILEDYLFLLHVAQEHGFDSINLDLINTPICEYRFRDDYSNTTDIFLVNEQVQKEWEQTRERVNAIKRKMVFTVSEKHLEEMVYDKEEWRIKFLRKNSLVKALIRQSKSFTHRDGTVPFVINMIYEDNEYFQAQYNLMYTEDQLSLYIWWLRKGCLSYDLPFYFGITGEQFEEILKIESDGRFEALGSSFRMPQIFLTIYSGREDLKEQYDIKKTDGLIGFISWMINYGIEEYKLFWFFNCDLNFHKFLHGRCPYYEMNNLTYLTHYDLLRDKESFDKESAEKIQNVSIQDLKTNKYINDIKLISERKWIVFENSKYKSDSKGKFAFNETRCDATVIGLHSSPIGIGEDVRRIHQVLKKAKLKTVKIDMAVKKSVISKRNSVNCEYNIFCQPAPDIMISGILLGDDFFNNRKNIALCAWELPKWPKSLEWILDFLDKVWVHSEFIRDSVPHRFRDKVFRIPLPVVVMPTIGKSRKDFNLPSKPFLYLSVFDFASWAQRKNPFACLEAFRLAFPYKKNDQVGLVIKSINSDARKDQYSKLKEIIKKDPRISIIDKILDKADLHDLFRSCDAFISLHRSEGFGRNIAEAMLLKIPVITTAFSGNMDFTHDDNSFLVNYALKELDAQDYIFAKGNYWAEPDIRSAANAMLNVINLPKPELQQKIEKAYRIIKNKYSIDYMAQNIFSLL